jgi:asparagine synthase (glutamine-hydrolysing)
MLSASGRLVIAFNGEIYNHLDLRQRLMAHGQAPTWRGLSDTETLLAAFEAWGVQGTLQACTGMFALALWDRQARRLTLARDRLGEKPLYYGRQGAHWLFGSELKALKAGPGFAAGINPDAVAALLGQGYIPGPATIYSGIAKLPAGTTVTLSAAGPDEPVPYWSLAETVASAQANPFAGTDSEALDLLEQTLGASIGRQMLADVPVGAFLSGGIDSSLVTALMQARSSRPVRTFSIGFEDAAYNEAPHAQAVATHLGTDHSELIVTAADALAVVPRLPELWDEPFADSSQIPTTLLCALARRDVTVALSGDGGDELFAGYSRYARIERLQQRLAPLPRPVRRLGGRVLRRLRGRTSTLVDVLLAPSDLDLYQLLLSHWKHPETVVIGATQPALQGNLPTLAGLPLGGIVEQAMARDQLDYLCDDILVKVDRAAMAASLETRVPLLDPQLVALAWRLPPSLRRRGGVAKWPLRQLLHRHVPAALVERPKMGFGVPIDSWLRGPLRDWAEALLDPALLRQQGLLRPEPIQSLWREHLAGRADWHYYLWDVLMVQAWLEHNT